ncbi:MAG: WXG100 family type VII secretion target [Mycobacterium sp.]|jgi:WXG100 family type VII secretion target|nr:MAG: WXG100 family type VII secretion target [Mycobacterium sp.]
MAELQVEPSELVAVSHELVTVADGLRSGIASLDNDVTGLMGTGWTGSAASAYAGVWKEWHEGAAQVVAGLTRMSGLLNDAAAQYTSTDAAGGAQISGSGL